jgi:hypothetical protein
MTRARDLSNRASDFVSVKDFGAVGDGVTDDTVAFTNAAATGQPVYIPYGSYLVTTSVSGTFFAYNDITFPSADVYYANLKAAGKSVNKNFNNGWGVYTEELDGDVNAAADIASLGVSYVIYYFNGTTDTTRVANAKKDFVNFATYGLGVLLWVYNGTNTATRTTRLNQFTDVENLIGWYVFDEPSANSVSLADQNAAITASKAVLDLPCVCADNGDYYPNFALSPNYDFVFIDLYYQTKNSNNPVLTDTDALNTYAVLGSFAPLYGANRIIPVYETYLSSSSATDISEPNKLRTLLYKKRMQGYGAFFMYSANKTNPTMLGIQNTAKLRRSAQSVMQFSIPYNRSTRANYFCFLNTSYGYTLDKLKASIISMIDSRSTATIEYYPARLPTRIGIFVTAAQQVVIDFGAVVKSVKINGTYFNNGVGPGVYGTFDVLVPETTAMTTGSIVASVTTSAGTSVAGNASFNVVLENINSRFVILKPTGAVWNAYTGFAALGFASIDL